MTPDAILADLSPATESNEASPLLQLPVELLQEIVSYLTPESKAILSLTCKHLLQTVGTEPWDDPALGGFWNAGDSGSPWRSRIKVAPMPPPVDVRVRDAFLESLARDANHLSFCKTCSVLHPNLPSPAKLRLKLAGKSRCLVDQGVLDWFPEDRYTIVWEHIKKAMDEHRESLRRKTLLSTDALDSEYVF